MSKNANFFVTKGFLPILLCKFFCQITWRVSLDWNFQVIPHISGLGSGWGVCECQLYFTFKSFRHFVLRDLGHCLGKKCILTLKVDCVLTKTGSPEGFACVCLLPHCSSWQQAFLFSKVLVCLVCAKRSTFFSGHNSVDHNIFFQRVSGFVTWLLAIPRHDLMLAFLRSAFLLAILPKRPYLWRNCWCLDRFFHFSIKSLQLCQCCSRLTVTSQTNALFVWLLGLVGWPDCCAFWFVAIFYFFFGIFFFSLTTLCYYMPCFYFLMCCKATQPN